MLRVSTGSDVHYGPLSRYQHLDPPDGMQWTSTNPVAVPGFPATSKPARRIGDADRRAPATGCSGGWAHADGSERSNHRRKVLVVGRFELYKDTAGNPRFRLKAGNGEIIATGEAYESKAGAQNGIESIQRNAPDAPVDDQTD